MVTKGEVERRVICMAKKSWILKWSNETCSGISAWLSMLSRGQRWVTDDLGLVCSVEDILLLKWSREVGPGRSHRKAGNSCIFITLPLSYWQEHQSELVVKRVDSGVEKEDVFIICLQRKNWILWHAWAKERTWFQLGWTNGEAVVLSESELGLVAYAFLLYSSPFLVLCYLLFLTGKKIKILPP